MGNPRIRKNWETNVVDCPSTTVPKKIATLRGGESITIKSLADDGHHHYIGPYKFVSSANGYDLMSGETMTFELPYKFGVENYIEIWALPTTAGNDICYFKLIDLEPRTQASA